MDSGIINFYSLSVAILACAFGVIFAPRMYIAAVSLFLLICFSGMLYLGLNAQYLAIFQFILCGLCLSVYIFFLLKKIGRWNLKLKLVQPGKIVFGSLFVFLLLILTCTFFYQEFNNSLYSVFSFITEKSSDVVKFVRHAYPLSLVILLVFVSASVLRVFLENAVVKASSSTGKEDEK